MRHRTPYKLVAAFAATSMLLAACGGEDEEPETEPETEETSEPEGEMEETEGEGEETEAEEPEGEASGFPEREIRYINRGSPGGGHDAFARGSAPLLEECFGQTILVENMTGGSGLVAADYMRNVEPDGYTIHLMDPVGLIGNAVVEDENFSFEEDFDWQFLGTITQRSSVFAVGPDSEFDTWEDFVAGAEEGGLRWSHTGLGSTHAYNAILVFDELGLPFPTFIPHESSPDVFTALARGDGDFTVLASDSVFEAVENGDAQAILQFSDDLEGVPTGADVGLEQFDNLLLSSLAVVAPPDTPEDIVEALRSCIEEVFASDELAQWGEENDRVVAPLNAEETEEQLRNVTEFYKENRDVIVELLENE